MRISDWSSDVCSSDLTGVQPLWALHSAHGYAVTDEPACRSFSLRIPPGWRSCRPGIRDCPRAAGRCGRPGRSEEHTSELQSLMRSSYAVFRLKKKTLKHTQIRYHTNHSIYLTT